MHPFWRFCEKAENYLFNDNQLYNKASIKKSECVKDMIISLYKQFRICRNELSQSETVHPAPDN